MEYTNTITLKPPEITIQLTQLMKMIISMPLILFLVDITSSAVAVDRNKLEKVDLSNKDSVLLSRLKRHGGESHDGKYKNEDDKKHGGIKMGVPNSKCDDAKLNLYYDWDQSSDFEYKCQPYETSSIGINKDVITLEECLRKEDVPGPRHTCMTTHITYDDKPPRGGPHRPLWPYYGEYLYCPPQRWVHVLEHGAVVFLYHPCAMKSEVEKFKDIAKNCLRRHIITPYRDLKEERPFALVTWGCRLLMNSVDVNAMHAFIKTHGLETEESKVNTNGQYKVGLIEEAHVVFDIDDSVLCPNDNMVAEAMEVPYMEKLTR